MKQHKPAGSEVEALIVDHLLWPEVLGNALVAEPGDGQSVVYVAHHAASREVKNLIKIGITKKKYNNLLHFHRGGPHSISPAVPLAQGPYW